jgi:hypothetical protein
MALKLFCGKCQEFIKEIDPDEASRLKGDVCKKCVDFYWAGKDKYLKAIDKMIQEIQAKKNSDLVKIEDIIHRELDL